MSYRGPTIGEAEVNSFERLLGNPLPPDYRQFLLEVNGGYPDDENARFSDEIINRFFCLSEKEDPSRDLQARALRAREMLPHPDLLFIGHFDGARMLIPLSGDHRGEVWSQDTVNPRSDDANPRVLWHDRRDMTKLADSFEEFVGKLQPLE